MKKRVNFVQFLKFKIHFFPPVLHQLREREPSAVLRASHLQAGAGGVQHGGHQLAPHRVRRQPRGSRPHRDQTSQSHVPH